MWPATLIIGMFVLIGALGTATAPTASADPWDYCNQAGPIQPNIGPGHDVVENSDWENNFLLKGYTYLFILSVEDQEDTNFDLNVEIDDETGDADITAYAENPDGIDADPPADSDWVDVNNVDVLDGIDNYQLVNWDTNGTPNDNFIADVEDEWGIDLSDYNDVCGTATADGMTLIEVTCQRAGTFEITYYDDDTNPTPDANTEEYICLNDPSAMTLTATPASVESHPALGNVSHSLIVATVTDKNGDYVGENYTVDWETTGCKIEGIAEATYEAFVKGLFANFDQTKPATGAAIEGFLAAHPGGLNATSHSDTFLTDSSPAPGYQPETRAAAILHCEGADPGTYTVSGEIDDDQFGVHVKFGATTDVTVVGPPAFINMVAEPTEQVCGEKSQILVTVTDALNQPVSDHTVVELITNYGGVLGGTGSSLAFPGVNPVNPLSSSAAETFGGVATAYLLTSTNHIGSYEVVASAGGSSLGAYYVYLGDHNYFNYAEGYFEDQFEDAEAAFEDYVGLYYYTDFVDADGYYDGNTGIFSTPVVTSQVTVTCTEAAPPEVTAPDTGTGTISPPNTGDAGLADSSSTSSTLLVIAGAAAFVLASLVSFRFVRR